MIKMVSATEAVIRFVLGNGSISLSSLKDACRREYNIQDKETEDAIQELVKQYKLIEIEYTTDMFTCRSLILPANTRINIRGVKPEPPRRIY